MIITSILDGGVAYYSVEEPRDMSNDNITDLDAQYLLDRAGVPFKELDFGERLYRLLEASEVLGIKDMCIVCGKPITGRASNNKYCSKECRLQALALQEEDVIDLKLPDGRAVTIDRKLYNKIALFATRMRTSIPIAVRILLYKALEEEDNDN